MPFYHRWRWNTVPIVRPANKKTKCRTARHKLTCLEENSCPAFENKYNADGLWLQRCNAQGNCSIGSNCKPRRLQRCTAKFIGQLSTSSPWISCSRKVVHRTRQCEAAHNINRQKTFCQYMKSLHSLVSHIIQICLLVIFSSSHDWNEHWKAIALLTFRQFREPWQNRSAAL